jgi:hypothetical protein
VPALYLRGAAVVGCLVQRGAQVRVRLRHVLAGFQCLADQLAVVVAHSVHERARPQARAGTRASHQDCWLVAWTGQHRLSLNCYLCTYGLLGLALPGAAVDWSHGIYWLWLSSTGRKCSALPRPRVHHHLPREQTHRTRVRTLRREREYTSLKKRARIKMGGGARRTQSCVCVRASQRSGASESLLASAVVPLSCARVRRVNLRQGRGRVECECLRCAQRQEGRFSIFSTFQKTKNNNDFSPRGFEVIVIHSSARTALGALGA